MIRVLGLCVGIWLAVSGCEREPMGRSPFSGNGAAELRGVRAVGHLSSEWLATDWIPELWRESIPEGVGLTCVWLDAKAYGGSLAFLLQGQDPDHVMRSLLRSGVLMAADRPETYRLQMEDLPGGRFLDRLMSRARRRRPGSSPANGAALQRYDRGDRLVLVPTVDLREWMFALADSLEHSNEPVPKLALALDGRSLARSIREQIQPGLRFFQGLAGASGAGESEARVLEGAVFGLRLLLEAMTQLEGAVFALTDLDSPRLDLRLTALSGTPLQLLVEAFEPLLLGEDPDASGDEAQLALALHPPRFRRAIESLSEPVLDDMSLEFVEQFESVLGLLGSRFGGLLLASVDAEGQFGLALSLRSDSRREDLALLDRIELLRESRESWRLERGFLVIGADVPDPPKRRGASDIVGRLWGSVSAPPWPGALRAELRRIDRGLWLQYDAQAPE